MQAGQGSAHELPCRKGLKACAAPARNARPARRATCWSCAGTPIIGWGVRPEANIDADGKSLSMNNQQAFDIAVLHLLNQGQWCVNSSGKSRYRGLRGGKNAVGALIPEILYASAMEGKTLQQLLGAA